MLVECDTSNPDVWMAHKAQLEAELIDLHEADGRIHLVNTCETYRERVVVINTAARNNLAVGQYGQTLHSSLDELGSKFVALWMINRQARQFGTSRGFHGIDTESRRSCGAQRVLR